MGEYASGWCRRSHYEASRVYAKTKICLIEETDDSQEEACFGSASIKVANNSKVEKPKGREPKEMSRPTAESRAGFVIDSQGAGVQITATAELALDIQIRAYMAFSPFPPWPLT